MQRRPHISAPFRPRQDAQEEIVAAAEPPPPEVAPQARRTVKPHLTAVDPVRRTLQPTAAKLNVRSKTQPAPARGSAQQENRLAGVKKAIAAWSSLPQPPCKPLGQHADASLATAAAAPRSSKELPAVPADAACQRWSTAESLPANTLATPPQLEAAQKSSWKISQAALARSIAARRAAFEESLVRLVSKPAVGETSAPQRAELAASSQRAGVAKTEGAASAKPRPPDHVKAAAAPQRVEQMPPMAVTGGSQRHSDTVAAAAGRGLGARTASSSSSRLRSSSLESKSYRSSAVFRALAARGHAAARRADAEGTSPVKRRSAVSLSPVRPRPAAAIPGRATGAVGLPSLAKGAEVASRPSAREQVRCKIGFSNTCAAEAPNLVPF